MDQKPQLIVPGVGRLYEALDPYAYPVMRFFTGILLVPHGGQKLFGWFGGNINATAGFFEKIGLVPGLPLAYLVAATEFFGGLAIALGLLTRIGAAGNAILLAVAAFHVHWANGLFWNKGGYEYPLLWMVLCLCIFIKGGGRLSVDQRLGREF